jgi:hypothetical protein
MKEQAVAVDIQMWREKQPEGKQQEFNICVTVTPKLPAVKNIEITLYQELSLQDGGYTPHGLMLEPYPLESGNTTTWPFGMSDIFMVLVRYQLEDDADRWHVAASGVWCSPDGVYFESGKNIKARSELFA